MQDSEFPRLYRFLRYASAAIGWLLYCYEWVHVSWQTPRQEPVTFVFLFILTVVLMHLAIAWWIDHNKLIAAAGKRGLSTRYIVPVFVQDYLGRQLVLHDDCRLSQEILVRVDGGTKFYIPAPVME
jgi:hypothetical protein